MRVGPFSSIDLSMLIVRAASRVKNYTCLRNTTHRRIYIYVSTYIAFFRVVMLNFLRGLPWVKNGKFACVVMVGINMM